MSSLSLYVIEQALSDLLTAREELLAEIPGLRQEEERAAELAAVEHALGDYVHSEIAKVDGIHAYLKYATLTAAASRQEAKDRIDAALRLEANVERLKALCVDIMLAAGKTRLEGTAGRVLAVQGNGGQQPLKIQDDVLPDVYRNVALVVPGELFAVLLGFLPRAWRDRLLSFVRAREPDQSAIRSALAAGEDVPGARLEERGSHLRVK
jgi:hypothetical protein